MVSMMKVTAGVVVVVALAMKLTAGVVVVVTMTLTDGARRGLRGLNDIPEDRFPLLLCLILGSLTSLANKTCDLNPWIRP